MWELDALMDNPDAGDGDSSLLTTVFNSFIVMIMFPLLIEVRQCNSRNMDDG